MTHELNSARTRALQCRADLRQLLCRTDLDGTQRATIYDTLRATDPLMAALQRLADALGVVFPGTEVAP